MIRSWVTACLMGLAAPAVAFDRMDVTTCQDSFARFGSVLAMGDADTAQMVQSVGATADGWCRIKGGTPGFEAAEFALFDWRSDETARWIDDGIPVLALEIRSTGLRAEGAGSGAAGATPDLSMTIVIRQDPDVGQVILEQALVRNDAGDVLSVSGVFERVFLSSASMMQVSMGSAVFKAGAFSMTLEGTHENPFGFDIDAEVRGTPQGQSDAAFDLISRLPEGVIDAASRAELTAYAGDLPRPVGQLDVTIYSERGLGLMQIGMSAYQSFIGAMEGTQTGLDLAVLLDGVTVTADWSPAAAVAD